MKLGAFWWFIIDVLCVAASFILSFAVRVPFPYLERELPRFIDLLFPLIILRIALFALFGLYRYIWQNTALRETVAVVSATVVGSIVATLLLVFVSLQDPIQEFPRSVLVFEAAITTSLVAGYRYSLRILDLRDLEPREAHIHDRQQYILDAKIQEWLYNAPIEVQILWAESQKWSLKRVLKRTFDIIVSLTALLIFAPLLLIVAILIKLESPGPVMADIPKRAGRHGVPFKMYKFRGMVPNAHLLLVNNPVLWEKYRRNNFKLLDDDPRLTRVGRFIRKTSIDELPNLINVLHGEMSIVGPRPRYPFEIIAQAERFPETIPDILKMLTVKPGLTGPWQVAGRSNLGYEERTKLEAEYAENHTLLGDIMLCLATIPVVLRQEGAH